MTFQYLQSFDRKRQSVSVMIAFMTFAVSIFGADIDPESDPHVQPFQDTPVSGYQLTFSDEFNGDAIDLEKWYFRTGWKLWSTQLPENNSVSDGYYHIHLKKEKIGETEYSGGGIISHKLFRYGYYESRMKVPKGQGWHSSFWMMRDKILKELPEGTVHIELDPAENDSSNPHHYQTDSHQWSPGVHYKLGTRQIHPKESLAEDFHVFGLEFTPTKLNYFFDGKLVRSTNAAEISHNDVNLWLTCLAGKLGKKTTAVDESCLPSEVLYDYVRFWEQLPAADIRILSPDPIRGVALPDTDHALQLLAETIPDDETLQVSIQWEKLSGPGRVDFADAKSENTSVRFSENGKYVLLCSATVGDVTHSDQIQVSVNAPVFQELTDETFGYTHAATDIRSGVPENCPGIDDELFIGKGWKGMSRVLLSYPLNTLPAGTKIKSTALTLWNLDGEESFGPIHLHELKRGFVEGKGEGFREPATGTGASWNKYDGQNSWDEAGGDFHGSELSKLPPFNATEEVYKTFPSSKKFVSAAQSAFEAETPLQLIAIAPTAEKKGGQTRFASNEATRHLRPTLRVEYEGNELPTIVFPEGHIETADARLELQASVNNANRVSWNKLSGPEEVEFVDFRSSRSIVFFHQPGDYVLQLSAQNQFGTSLRELQVKVTDATFHSMREKKPNILFIAIDDLRTELGCYDSSIAVTPNIDRLSSNGLQFNRAYCQQAICGPSRASILTGSRPDTIGITHNYVKIRELNPHIVTLPEHFGSKGYKTVFMGKVYHHGDVLQDSWNTQPVQGSLQKRELRDLRGFASKKNREITEKSRKEMFAKYGEVAKYGLAMGPAYESADVSDDTYVDGYHAELAIETLKAFAQDQERPFFLGLGFNKPHLNWIAPKKYWDLYDRDSIPMASETSAPHGAPAMSVHPSFELRVRHGIPKQGDLDTELARTLKHAYLACVSYVDAQIGKVMQALEELNLDDNTIVILWSDHGFHLGDMGIWCKATNYEISTRVPLILSTPEMRKSGTWQGVQSDALVELVDMYPTLCDLAGITKPQHIEGHSFAPLIKNPNRPWKQAAFSQFPNPALREWGAYPIRPAMRETYFGPLLAEMENNIQEEFGEDWDRELFEHDLMGYAMRTDRYRLIAWLDTKHPEREAIAVELYDHQKDPKETQNIAEKHPKLTDELLAQLKAGWREALPENI